MNEASENLQLIDLGDVVAETKQISPVPPYFVDSTFGFGSRPNLED